MKVKKSSLLLQKFPINVTKVPHVTEVPFFGDKSARSYGSLSLSVSLSLSLTHRIYPTVSSNTDHKISHKSAIFTTCTQIDININRVCRLRCKQGAIQSYMQKRKEGLDYEQKKECKDLLTDVECLESLKTMGSNKSPGMLTGSQRNFTRSFEIT